VKLDPVQAAFVEAEKQRIAAMKSSMDQMRAQQDVLRDDLSERTRINEEIRKQIETENEAERAKQQAAESAKRDQERLDDLLRKENERLEQQRIELEKGAEAAHAFALEKQGLSKADAERIAKEQAAIDELKEKDNTVDLGTQAVESRLLTRGPMQKTAEKQLKVMEQIRDKLPLTSSPSQKLEVRMVS
jgi:colicin import membrane protein